MLLIRSIQLINTYFIQIKKIVVKAIRKELKKRTTYINIF